jgi:hypothetical protein
MGSLHNQDPRLSCDKRRSGDVRPFQGVRVSLALAVPVRGLCNEHGFGAAAVTWLDGYLGCGDCFFFFWRCEMFDFRIEGCAWFVHYCGLTSSA